jgi:hypothetical protein
MKYFTTAVEAALLLSADQDSETLKFDEAFWSEMVVKSRYVLAQRAAHRPLTAT